MTANHIKQHYEHQHPDYDAKDALEEDSKTLPLDPEFQARNAGRPKSIDGDS